LARVPFPRIWIKKISIGGMFRKNFFRRSINAVGCPDSFTPPRADPRFSPFAPVFPAAPQGHSAKRKYFHVNFQTW